MNIALVVPGFSAGPEDWAIPALLNLAHELARRHRVTVFSQRYPAAGIYRFNGLTHIALGAGQRFGAASPAAWLRTAQAIVREHRRAPFDLLHAFWADEAGFSAALAGAAIRRPVIVSIGGGELVRLPEINYGAQRFLTRQLTTRFALRRAACVTAGSEYTLDVCRMRGVSPRKLRLAPLGVDTDRFRPPPHQETIPPALVQAASLLPVKNQSLLLEVLARVKIERPDIVLHVAGSGPQQNALRKLAQRLKVSQNIEWHGALPYPAMADLFGRAAIYVQTSLHESQGMAVLEAMACGLPVVGTPVGAARDLAAAPPGWDAPGLAAQITGLLHNPVRYAKFSAAARERIETNFSLPETTRFFEAIYTELL